MLLTFNKLNIFRRLPNTKANLKRTKSNWHPLSVFFKKGDINLVSLTASEHNTAID